mgnify:CR=1 FL=1
MHSGLGTNIISAGFAGQTIYSYDWLLKLLFTIFTLAIGFQGGEVTPLFSIGTSLGVILGGILGPPPMLCAARSVPAQTPTADCGNAPVLRGPALP